MNITQEKIDDLNAVIKVQLKEEDYQDKIDTQLKEYRKKASIPGFRKGNVPMGMIKKMVGTNLLVEELNKILSDSLQNYLINEKLDVLGNPLPKMEDEEKIDWENQKEFEFKYEVGLAPSFKLDKLDKFKFEIYKIKVSDKDVQKYVDDLARRYGKMTNPEVAEAGDMLFGKFEELDATGNSKEGGINHSSVIIIKSVTDKKLQKELVGAKKGDTFKVNPKSVSEHQTDQAEALGVDVSQLKSIISQFNYTVEKVNRVIPTELNQELFDKVFGPETVKSEKEFRAKIAEELNKGLLVDSENKFINDVQEELLKSLNLKLPDAFLKKWIVASNEKPISSEQIEAEYDQYAKGLKWQLIKNKIIELNDVKVAAEEVVDYTKGLLMQQMQGMGMGDIDDERLSETANNVLQNQEEARRIYEMLYDSKLKDIYKSTFKLKEKEIDYENFVSLVNKQK
ncbi:MAG: trigger factor [Flavobacteriales bacterium CG18_big_fil_WC_8_21_14_2_50_32_9]|nr:trigger factor [Flavobacteriales bacterium]PIQ15876.1 MAG: trigger factor [Flavobacteriales bacterium CG18_big_fil_WC_8_21_14_2_50_32_9]PJC62882.1 MAG: trigger factor [Flavobacteriales bacterium CG_4_9_14_0_2_um_filter_32_27]